MKTEGNLNRFRNKNQAEFVFLEEIKIKKTSHGGMLSNAKVQRPFLPKKWLHISNRSSRAVGNWSMLGFKNQTFIESLIKETAKKCFVQVADFVNMGNHFHLKAKAKRREDLQKFLRIISAKIAKHITKAKKGFPKGRFWDGLVFSRLLLSAIEELRLKGYFEANRIEKSSGYKKREEFLLKHNAWIKTLRRKTNNKNQNDDFNAGATLSLVL